MKSPVNAPAILGLHADLGHARPGVEDVGRAMPGEHREVIGAEILPVPDLDAVAKAAGKGTQKRVELLAEGGGVRKNRLRRTCRTRTSASQRDRGKVRSGRANAASKSR